MWHLHVHVVHYNQRRERQKPSWTERKTKCRSRWSSIVCCHVVSELAVLVMTQSNVCGGFQLGISCWRRVATSNLEFSHLYTGSDTHSHITTPAPAAAAAAMYTKSRASTMGHCTKRGHWLFAQTYANRVIELFKRTRKWNYNIIFPFWIKVKYFYMI